MAILITWPFFLAFFVLFAYLYAYVPFGVLGLSKRLSVRISFFIFYAIFTLLIAFARLDIVVLSPYAIAIMILSILILKRKGYFTDFTKARVAMDSVCLLVFTWQLEVPQMVVFEIASKSLDKTDGMTEILNENFNPNKFTYSFSKELEDCIEKNINCPFFSFKFPIYNIYDKVNGEKIIVAREYGIAYRKSTLTKLAMVLCSFGEIKRIKYHISKNENNILY